MGILKKVNQWSVPLKPSTFKGKKDTFMSIYDAYKMTRASIIIKVELCTTLTLKIISFQLF